MDVQALLEKHHPELFAFKSGAEGVSYQADFLTPHCEVAGSISSFSTEKLNLVEYRAISTLLRHIRDTPNPINTYGAVDNDQTER